MNSGHPNNFPPIAPRQSAPGLPAVRADVVAAGAARSNHHHPKTGCRSGFTLIEVMIAMGIFFIAIFAILDVVSTCLRNARLLQKVHVDTSPIMAILYQTNKFTEGSDSGQIDGSDLRWGTDIHPDEIEGSNGLWRIQATMVSGRNEAPETNWALRWGDPPPANGLPR